LSLESELGTAYISRGGVLSDTPYSRTSPLERNKNLARLQKYSKDTKLIFYKMEEKRTRESNLVCFFFDRRRKRGEREMKFPQGKS